MQSRPSITFIAAIIAWLVFAPLGPTEGMLAICRPLPCDAGEACREGVVDSGSCGSRGSCEEGAPGEDRAPCKERAPCDRCLCCVSARAILPGATYEPFEEGIRSVRVDSTPAPESRELTPPTPPPNV